MKISELIRLATDAMEQEGDKDVVVVTDTPDGMYSITHDVEADAISYPMNDNDDELKVFGIGWKTCFNGDEEEIFTPHLKLVVGGR